jgi:DNA-binding SARP family transcriptional activator
LRRTLCPDAREAGQCPYVRLADEMVSLEDDLIAAVDMEQFEAAAALEANDAGRYQAALAAYAGDLLPEDLYEEWTIPRREHLRELCRAFFDPGGG